VPAHITFEKINGNKEFISFDTLLFFAAMTMRRKDRETALGDIDEKYKNYCHRFGVKRAKQIIARDILSSLAPYIRDVMRTHFIKTLKAVGWYHVVKFFVG
jgi:hypothetical protein